MVYDILPEMSPQRHSTFEDAVEVVRILRRGGYEAYLAGGCVRDRLLGRAPKDHDVATAARPEQIRTLFKRTIPVGEAFGVILVLQGESAVETATFRKDSGSADGRHPESVEYSNAKEDVLRRDFTVNGLLYDPIEDRVLDYVGGREDLTARTIRAIGEPVRRMREDYLRLLRAVRFATALDFRIDEATSEAIRQEAQGIERISRERVCDELTRLLTAPRRAEGLRQLRDLGLLSLLLPEVSAMEGVAQPEQFHPEGGVWIHTLGVLEKLPGEISPELAWGALLHDVGKPPTYREAPDRIRFHGHDVVGERMSRKICRRLKMSNRSTEQICRLVRTHLQFKDVQKMRPARLRRFLSEEGFSEALELHKADCLASHGDLSHHSFCTETLEKYKSEPIRPPPLLDGNDLISIGYAPGPLFSKILRELEDAQLEGEITNKEQALAWIQERFPRPA
jgi:poly(A) polymerase